MIIGTERLDAMPPRREVNHEYFLFASLFAGGAMHLIELHSVDYHYENSARPALQDISLSVDEGEYLALVGNNGSGKSTLVRLFNGLRLATSGTVLAAGKNPAERANLQYIRRTITIVFQSPTDQIVSSCVEEDVAFGPSNLGLSQAEIEVRVQKALQAVGLLKYAKRPTRFLSGGQQQKLAIAGALAMQPRCIIFDEATSMLDPKTRASVLSLMKQLSEQGIAIIHVTHDMDEAIHAGRIIALDKGRLAYDGKPERFFTAGDKTQPLSLAESLGLELPSVLKLARNWGLTLPLNSTYQDMAKQLVAAAGQGKAGHSVTGANAGNSLSQKSPKPLNNVSFSAQTEAIRYGNVRFSYLSGTTNEVLALDDVSFLIPKGTLVAFVGMTGSGKSTALQLANALLKPVSGDVFVFGRNTREKSVDLKALRMNAPFSIQRPESALFEAHAADDVAFGPRNQNLKGQALVRRVETWMNRAGLPYSEFRDRLIKTLSGGEKRKLALAGVFALESETLLLDEPGAALDPGSRASVFSLLEHLHEQGKTILFATHSMDEAIQADLAAVFKDGRLLAFGPPREVFYRDYDESWGIDRPRIVQFALALEAEGVNLPYYPVSAEEVLSFFEAGRLP